MTSHLDLMRLHIEALFTHDAEGCLADVNEPGGVPAPRFFLGRTADGAVWRFRHDVDRDVRSELEAAVNHDSLGEHDLDTPIDSSGYDAILVRSGPVQKRWVGPAFTFPSELPSTIGTIPVIEENAQLLDPLLHDWIADIRLCQPMIALTVDGRGVSVCCSVRRTGTAHEVGVETVPAFRGRGYAMQVVTAWARAVRAMERIPLYSTSWQNQASRAVARKLGLIRFGNDLHIT